MGDHKSHVRQEDTSHVGDHMYIWGTIQYLYLMGDYTFMCGDHTIPVSIKVRVTIRYLFHIRYGGP